MIKFIDIEHGTVYDGTRPYIFWMDKEQSTNIIYVKRICVLTDQDTLNVSIPSNTVFRLLDMGRLDMLIDINVNEFEYKNIQQLYTNSLTSTGIQYNNYYVHMLYIAAQSDYAGEVHENFTINNEVFEIAADFYTENEILKVNLANFGVEIPESIQNAVYDENVHEESKDNILLNRKYKELLLNYWSIVAGRGSYKSLIDSLKWFEYGDLVRIEEIWKHDEWGQTRLNREELNAIMTSDVRSTLSNFTKTTYMGIYLALQKFITVDGEVQYDKLANIEVNISPEQTNEIFRDNSNYEGLLGDMIPKLEQKFFKWSIQEMSLKMYLLGSFYESYFMPIHLDLLHSTIESIVFTNTIKCLNMTHMDRVDYLYNTQAFECSIKDGDSYCLHDVNVQAGDTLLRHYDSDDSSDDGSDDTTNMANIYDKSSGTNVEYVDLGLPSGVLWAKYNIGATSETEYGGYYAFGEIETKSTYTWGTYRWGDPYNGGFTKYNSTDEKTELESEDDAAHVNLGGKWRMPTTEEIQELIDNCTYSWETDYQESGVNGCLFTAQNGNTLFIPAAGVMSSYGISDIGNRCTISSKCLSNIPNLRAMNCLNINIRVQTPVSISSTIRSVGVSIRPVASSIPRIEDSDDYDDYEIFGVTDEYNHPIQYDGESSDDEIVNNRLKTFMINNFNGIGVVLPFECVIPADQYDFINYEKLIVATYNTDRTEIKHVKELEKHQLYGERSGQFNVRFKLLLTEEGPTDITLYFSTSGGRSYIKTIHINVLGDVSCRLKLYKVKSCNKLEGLNADDYTENNIYDVDPLLGEDISYPDEFKRQHIRKFNDYMFTHTRGVNEPDFGTYQTFVSCDTRGDKYNDVKLNYILIFDAKFFDECEDQDKIDFIKSYTIDDPQNGQVNLFDIGKKDVVDENEQVIKTYYILVSKASHGFVGDSVSFDSVIEQMRNYLNTYILRFSKGFFFQHHYLEELGTRFIPTYRIRRPHGGSRIIKYLDSYTYEFGQSLDDYTITDNDTVCVIPDIKYSNIKLDEVEWIFKNVSTRDKDEYRFTSIREPFIGSTVKNQLNPGFYDIIFRYKVGDTYGESRLNSAFRKV